MTLRKKLMIACAIGLAISGSGIGLIALGGWGPCGPASTPAAIGGWLTVAQVDWLCQLVPGLDAFVGSVHADFPFLVLWPALIWSLVAFGLLTAWQRWISHQDQRGPLAHED